MKIILKNDVFIRHEKGLPGENVFIFVGKTREMFEANEDVLDIINLVKKNLSSEEIAGELVHKYSQSDLKSIEDGVEQTMQFLIDCNVADKV